MAEIIYTRIERAIVARLREGLGKMVRACDSYGGELDDDLGNVITLLPAVWVTFGGINDTKPVSTARQKYRVSGTWVVMIGEKTNVRGNQPGRQGGPMITEVGTYPLLYAVRRLLSGQDLGIEIDQLRPGRVRTLFNTRVSQTPMTAFAAEFRADWIEAALDNGRWPAPEGIDDLDALFARHAGRTDTPYPDVSGINIPLPTQVGD
ncbi:DUF1834 family protein [Castellaniella caeni]|uniref:DUF1834 family protein n=1 Tax=Castellaniella caeni TaxID=266123 RepID=UPI000C9ECE64|nr:DUF1834 family protein [Castellaniella caeni]